MFAPGATVCAYSTSRVVSPPQPVMSESLGFQLGIFPSGVMIVNDGGAGSLNCWSKTARSWEIVGEPNESTITIVSPRPVTPRAYSGARSYAVSTCSGVRQREEKAAMQCACEGVAMAPPGWITPGVVATGGGAAEVAAGVVVTEHPATLITPAASAAPAARTATLPLRTCPPRSGPGEFRPPGPPHPSGNVTWAASAQPTRRRG